MPLTNMAKRKRLEITKEILEAILQNLSSTLDDVNLRAAFCTAFAGFIRMGDSHGLPGVINLPSNNSLAARFNL